MYRRVALVLLVAMALVVVAGLGIANAALKPQTATHSSSGSGTQSSCSACHNAAGSGGFNAHATHQRTMWLAFNDGSAPGNGCAKCHSETATGYEGDLSYTTTSTNNLRRKVNAGVVCASCHGRFRTLADGDTGHTAGVSVSSSCVSCHKPDGSGSAMSAATAHTGVSWINHSIIDTTTVNNICLLCHGADGSTGLNRRAWYQTADSTWTP